MEIFQYSRQATGSELGKQDDVFTYMCVINVVKVKAALGTFTEKPSCGGKKVDTKAGL